MIEDTIFKKCSLSKEKLLSYGFIKEDNKYIYSKNILNDTFKVVITIDNKLTGKVIDLDFNEEYNNFRFENTGEFNSKIKNEYIDILNDIKNKCYIEKYFISNQANRITKLIYERYSDNPLFLWNDDNGVFKNPRNDKWYGIIMHINKNKIDNEDQDVNILNVKLDKDEIVDLLKEKGFYTAYHMNKKYWITIVLDDTITDELIMDLIAKSHEYTETTNNWIIPANVKYYDVVNCFNDTNKILWKQSNNILVNDIVFLYVGAPISSILYKCKVLKTDIPYKYKDSNLSMNKVMEIELIKRYEVGEFSFKRLKEYKVTARGPRSLPKKLLEDLG